LSVANAVNPLSPSYDHFRILFLPPFPPFHGEFPALFPITSLPLSALYMPKALAVACPIPHTNGENMKENPQEKQRQRKWLKVLKILFKYRYSAPFTSKDFYDEHFGELYDAGIHTWESLDNILRRRIVPYRYRFKIPKNAPKWKPYYYAINPNGVRRLRQLGHMSKNEEYFYQEEVRGLVEEYI